MSHLVAPSMLAADFANLQRDIEMVNESDADWFHVDVMDGVFVPNISFGFPAVQAIQKHAAKPLDVHAMLVNVDKYITEFKKMGAANLTVHLEGAEESLPGRLDAIRAAGMNPGVAFNPDTPVADLENIINDVYMVCLMSVNPGFGGQQFKESTYDKVKALKGLITDKGADALIEVDGGVGPENAEQLVACGADVLVAGSSVFASDDPLKTIAELKQV